MGKHWRAAELLNEHQRWDEAGLAWWDIAQRARDKRDQARCAEAAARAADAFRRADRPAKAARAAKLGWDSGRRGPEDVALLAGVFLDAGQPDVAWDLLDHPAEPTAVFLDVRVSLALALGKVDQARLALEDLARLGGAPAEIATAFRQAQIDRLDGLFERADMGFSAVITALSGYGAVAAGPAAAAMGERGDLCLFAAEVGHGAHHDAIPHFEGAVAGWRVAGREGPLRRASAALLRARRGAGETGLTGVIAGWADDAEAREMPALWADLRVAEALTGGRQGLAAVAERLGQMPLLQARTRVISLEQGEPVNADLTLAALGDDAGWSARGLRALARREGDAEMLAEAETRLGALFDSVEV